MKKYLRKMFLLRLRMFLVNNAKKRSKLLKKKNVFSKMGENVHFQPRKIPADPKFISFGDNVIVASGVLFVTHDLINRVFINDKKVSMRTHVGCISVGDNVFIGSNCIILPNVRIGNNVIIGAGSVITKDIPDGEVVGGNPAHKIGDYESLFNKRCIFDLNEEETNRLLRIDEEWEKFNNN